MEMNSTPLRRTIINFAGCVDFDGPTPDLYCASQKDHGRILLSWDVSALTEAEERIAASFERPSKDVCRIQKAQQAMYSLIDSFVRLFLLCVPEPSGDEIQPAKTRAAARYNNLVFPMT